MIFGKLFKTTEPVRYNRKLGIGHEELVEYPAGTEGLVIANLDRVPMLPADRAAIRETARYNASQGRPGVIVMFAEQVRFMESACIEYVETNRPDIPTPQESEA